MKTPDQIIRNDPVLMETMRRHDIGWSDITERADGTLYLSCAGPAEPAIEIDTERAEWSMSISWHVSGKEVRYDLERDGAIITVRDTQLPQATLSGLSGKRASCAIDMPGFDRLAVELAVLSNAFPGNPLDLRMSVHAIDEQEGFAA